LTVNSSGMATIASGTSSLKRKTKRIAIPALPQRRAIA